MLEPIVMTYSDYTVQIGHAVVSVKGRCKEEALNLARRELCLQMPRLFDVITTADQERFEINRIRISPST